MPSTTRPRGHRRRGSRERRHCGRPWTWPAGRAADPLDGAGDGRDGRTGKEVIADDHPHALFGACRGPPGQGQLRRAPRDAARVGALRSRAGRLHGGRPPARRPLRAGERRHALPRRGRRHVPGHAGQGAARAPGPGVPPSGRHRRSCAPTPASWRPPTASSSRRRSARALFREDLYFRLNVIRIHIPHRSGNGPRTSMALAHRLLRAVLGRPGPTDRCGASPTDALARLRAHTPGRATCASCSNAHRARGAACADRARGCGRDELSAGRRHGPAGESGA